MFFDETPSPINFTDPEGLPPWSFVERPDDAGQLSPPTRLRCLPPQLP
jgi:hypothetical protein